MLDISLEKQKRYRKSGSISKSFKYDNYTYAVNPPVQPYSDNVKVEVEGCVTGNYRRCLFQQLNWKLKLIKLMI